MPSSKLLRPLASSRKSHCWPPLQALLKDRRSRCPPRLRSICSYWKALEPQHSSLQTSATVCGRVGQLRHQHHGAKASHWSNNVFETVMQRTAASQGILCGALCHLSWALPACSGLRTSTAAERCGERIRGCHRQQSLAKLSYKSKLAVSPSTTACEGSHEHHELGSRREQCV